MSDVLKQILGNQYNNTEMSEYAPLAFASATGGLLGAISNKMSDKDPIKGALYGGASPILAYYIIKELSKKLSKRWDHKDYKDYHKDGGSLRNYLHFSVGAYSQGKKEEYDEKAEEIRDDLKNSLSTVGITKL